jgi:L-seryl-tRNA(Ser) seleniumtransferase
MTEPRGVDARRAIPSVAALLESEDVVELLTAHPRSTVVRAIRTALARARDDRAVVSHNDWKSLIVAELANIEARSLRNVINATGVILHTNLGRAPLANAAIEAIRELADGYTNLEYDLEKGSRGSRYVRRWCSP